MNEDENTEVDLTAAAVEAMLSGNRIQFADHISALLHQKATDAVEAVRDELAQVIFADPVEEEEVEELEAEGTEEAESTEEGVETETSEESESTEEK